MSNSPKFIYTCPFGSTCEKTKVDENGQVIEIQRCRLYVRMVGQDEQGKPVDDNRCSYEWMPLMLHENSKLQVANISAIDDFKNEMVNANASAQQVLISAALANQYPNLSQLPQ